MDRASFLRSLNFLRPLPPNTWDSINTNTAANDDDGEPYSGSTITPPSTPSKNNHNVMLFEDSLFVASIEPMITLCLDNGGNNESGGGKNNDEEDHLLTTSSTRKRGRSRINNDGVSAPNKLTTVGPAFFQNNNGNISNEDNNNNTSSSAETTSKTTDTVQENAMDIDNDKQEPPSKEGDGGEGEEQQQSDDDDVKLQINSDPSLCTFEAAIVKKLPLLFGDERERERDGLLLSTPTKKQREREMEHEIMESNSAALIFRFGNHFVFQVDESSIVDLRYEPGSSDESNIASSGQDKELGVGEEGDKVSKEAGGDSSPPSKRQRNEGENATHSSKKAASLAKQQLPASLTISFASCTIRIFSLEGKNSDSDQHGSNHDAAEPTGESSRPSSRIWGTLAKAVESVESRLMNARSVLMQQFDIESNKDQRQSPLWKMAPPGSGSAFHSWSESLELSSFHSNSMIKFKTSSFLEEDWSQCLNKNNTIECPGSTTTTPQKSSSPSKTGSSSTTFEQGQKEQPSLKNNGSSSQSHSAQQNGATNDDHKDAEKHTNGTDPSELTHETHETSQESSVGPKPAENNDEDVESINEDLVNSPSVSKWHQSGNGGTGNENGKKQMGGSGEKMAEEDTNDTADDKANHPSWRDTVIDKYHSFEKSAAYMEKAMDSTALLSQQHQKKGTGISKLTSCAKSLSNSYLSTTEFMDISQQCENTIEDATTEMEELLDKMFPARGRKGTAVTASDSENCQTRIEELMRLRKEAVAAKFAMLMIPKR